MPVTESPSLESQIVVGRSVQMRARTHTYTHEQELCKVVVNRHSLMFTCEMMDTSCSKRGALFSQFVLFSSFSGNCKCTRASASCERVNTHGDDAKEERVLKWDGGHTHNPRIPRAIKMFLVFLENKRFPNLVYSSLVQHSPTHCASVFNSYDPLKQNIKKKKKY